eukprot:10696466-Alexandrium_andersonii.AAC.1
MADCGLRRVAARTGLWRIPDCILGTLQCKDARPLRLQVKLRNSRGTAIDSGPCTIPRTFALMWLKSRLLSRHSR